MVLTYESAVQFSLFDATAAQEPDARETPSRPAHDKLKKVRHAPDFFCRCKRVPGREIGCPETHETMGNGGDKWFRLGG